MPRKIRQIRIEGNIAYVPLTKGYEAVIDAADVPLVDGHNWYADADGRSCYAATNMRMPDGKRKIISLHKHMTGFGITDHIDGDGLNNRRSNLREATAAENVRNKRRATNNTSGYKGVHWHKQRQRWQAKIMMDGKSFSLGLFDRPESAHEAYRAASARLHGEFGRIE